jgi:hypothetical protein
MKIVFFPRSWPDLLSWKELIPIILTPKQNILLEYQELEGFLLGQKYYCDRDDHGLQGPDQLAPGAVLGRFPWKKDPKIQ